MHTRSFFVFLLAGLVACGCKPLKTAGTTAPAPTLPEARRGFKTKLIRQERTDEPAPNPPSELFHLVRYHSPAGPLPAYVGVKPADQVRHPAIIWLIGGFSNSISDLAWSPGPPENDQSATAFREAGIVMMYPALRGGNDHPGFKECFFGEVDDVIAAAQYLSTLDYVDPQRIYLGGHSTGGTLALLVAESTAQFRAVFSFGPTENVAGYGADVLPFDPKNKMELVLRAPVVFLQGIKTPTFVFEGAEGRSNIESLRAMAAEPHPTFVHFHEIKNADHFSTLAPTTRVIARKILADRTASSNITFGAHDLDIRKSTPLKPAR